MAEPVGHGRHRTGSICVLPLVADFDAWLGLNRASALQAPRIIPVMGLRFTPYSSFSANDSGLSSTRSRPSVH